MKQWCALYVSLYSYVRVTSHAEVFRYTSCSYTLLSLALLCNLSALQTGTTIQQMPRQQPLNAFTNRDIHTLRNDIFAHGKRDYRPHLAVIYFPIFCFHLRLRCLHNHTTWTGYIWKSRCVTFSLPWTMPQRTQILMTSYTLAPFNTYTFYV